MNENEKAPVFLSEIAEQFDVSTGAVVSAALSLNLVVCIVVSEWLVQWREPSPPDLDPAKIQSPTLRSAVIRGKAVGAPELISGIFGITKIDAERIAIAGKALISKVIWCRQLDSVGLHADLLGEKHFPVTRCIELGGLALPQDVANIVTKCSIDKGVFRPKIAAEADASTPTLESLPAGPRGGRVNQNVARALRLVVEALAANAAEIHACAAPEVVQARNFPKLLAFAEIGEQTGIVALVELLRGHARNAREIRASILAHTCPKPSKIPSLLKHADELDRGDGSDSAVAALVSAWMDDAGEKKGHSAATLKKVLGNARRTQRIQK